MKSPSLYVLAVAFLSAPLFMGQAAPTLNGGGGCGCSDASDKDTTAVNSGDSVVGDASGGDGTITPGGDTGSTDEAGETPQDTPPDTSKDACEVADATGSVRAKDWSQDVESFVGLPVNEECKAECGGTGDDSPWTLSLHLGGSLFSESRTYSFSIMKDEFKDKVRYLEAKRDAADPDGCPAESQDPCWRTCTEGECIDGDLPIKDGDVMEKEAKAMALDYLTQVCKMKVTAEDLDADDWGKRLQAAFAELSLVDSLQCAESATLAVTQVVPWAEQVLKAGLVRDEKGEPYTAEQIFKCVKKSVLKD